MSEEHVTDIHYRIGICIHCEIEHVTVNRTGTWDDLIAECRCLGVFKFTSIRDVISNGPIMVFNERPES